MLTESGVALLAPAWQDVCMVTDYFTNCLHIAVQVWCGCSSLEHLGADLGALLGLNLLLLPLDLATFLSLLPAKNLLRANYVSLVIFVLLTLKWEEECHFPKAEHQEMSYFSLVVKSEAIGGTDKSFSELFCRSPTDMLCQVWQHQHSTGDLSRKALS